MSVIRIMIAENDPGQLQAVSAALAKEDDIDIVSSVSTWETAIKQLSEVYDVLVLNPAVLKEHSLSQFIRSAQTKSHQIRVIQFLTEIQPDDVLIADIRAGSRGYIKASDSPGIVSKAIHAVHGGEIWAERRILGKAICKPIILPETLQMQVPGLPSLTNREVEMLALVLQGASNREIADRSSISERTVKTHLYRVYRKLNVKSRTKAIALLSNS